MIGSAEVRGVRVPERPAGGQGRFISVGRGRLVPSHRNGHGDDERNEVVVSWPLGVQADLRVGGTPRPAGFLRKTVDGGVTMQN